MVFYIILGGNFMKLNKKALKNYLSSSQKELDNHLTMRVCYLMEQLRLFEKHEDEEIELFEVLTRLIFLADESPAESIANLMVPLNTEGSYLLDKNTITESASFLRDFLRKDYILYILKGWDSESKTDSSESSEQQPEQKESHEAV